LALDIGGANLKAANGRGFALSRPFALWRHPERLAEELDAIIAASPPAEHVVATMTGELADCFETKAHGVEAIVTALAAAAGKRDVSIYLTDGTWVTTDEACRRPLEAAASNWHALAAYAARHVTGGVGLLVDIGSTTCDIIPIVHGRPAARGSTDPERIATGELVYTGVERSPVCGVVAKLPWRKCQCRVAQELFATTWDAYLMIGDLPEQPENQATADGRPATRARAHDRLARAICADRTMFDANDARRAADAVAAAQCALVAEAIGEVVERLGEPPMTVVVSGEGAFLARRAVRQVLPSMAIVDLTALLGADVARVAPAHALAELTRERGER
jgi:hypothetical protein